jgi:hypothetical protein
MLQGLAVYRGRECIGYLFARGRQGTEAFDIDTKSIGIFPDQKSAADAISRAAEDAA